MKIEFEDRELEKFVMQGESCIAVPIEVFVPKDGECVVTVYSAFENIARKFAEKFKNDPLCEDAEAFIKEKFSALMKEAGYEYDGRFCHRIIHFAADSSTKLCQSEIKPVKISTNYEFERYYNYATRDVEFDDEDELDVCFAVVEDGKILSFAAVNDISDDESLEINVETSVESRGKGYATAAVAALTEYLISKGEKVSYKCRVTNSASCRVAEKAGLEKIGESYSFVCYADA